MLALAQRFEGGRLSARDCVRIIGAGLRGAGYTITDDAVARMQADGGISGFVDIVARLLTITFGARPSPNPVRDLSAQPPIKATDPLPPPDLAAVEPPARSGQGRAGGHTAPANPREVQPPVPFPGMT